MTQSVAETYEARELAAKCAAAVAAERDASVAVENAQYALIEATLIYGAAIEARRAADDAEYAYYERMD
mgnify:CR=1 FL=1|tara:strand:+ start:135 stop:341 length:207 start_codon:yes stop_codon:yes gene_type:complete